MTTPAAATDVVIRLGSRLTAGWVAFDSVELERVSGSGNLAPIPGFEDGEVGWTTTVVAGFPATSFVLDDSDIADGRYSHHAWAIGNLVYGELVSDRFRVDEQRYHDLYLWVRGERDGDGSYGDSLEITIKYYRENGGTLYQTKRIYRTTVIPSTWQQITASQMTPGISYDNALAEIHIAYRLASGWLAVDDVQFVNEVTGDDELANRNPGFEQGEWRWTAVAQEGFPATAMWLAGEGIAAPHGGAFAYSISNLAAGWLESDAVEVIPDTDYEVTAWVRGEVDAEDSEEQLLIGAYFYDSGGGVLGGQDVFAGGAGDVTGAWAQLGGVVTSPPGAATMRVVLGSRFASGWVSFDDVEAVEVQ